MNLLMARLTDRHDVQAPVVAPSAEGKDVMPRKMVLINRIVASKAF